jgi:hypothetical protein
MKKKHLYRHGDIKAHYDGNQRYRDRILRDINKPAPLKGRVFRYVVAYYVRAGPNEPSQFIEQQRNYFDILFPKYHGYSDLGYGHDPHRAQFTQLMDLVYNRKVLEIHVMNLDRLGTIGIEYIQLALKKMDVKLVFHEAAMLTQIKQKDPALAKYLEANVMGELIEAHQATQKALVQWYNISNQPLPQQEAPLDIGAVELDDADVEMSDISD